jgi:hypothetical protein
MFLGHFALGFAAKRTAPTVSLGTAFLAAQLADLIWPTLVVLGVERVEIDPGNTAVTPLAFESYPWSHSLLTLAAWGALFALAHHLIRRSGRAAALTLAALVVSHWVLDVVTHRPDMPLLPGGGPLLGLGLWHSRAGTMLVELLLFAVGLALYARGTVPLDRLGRVALWLLVGFLLAVSVANLVSPPPPSVDAVAFAGHATWLLVAWGYWIDRHRAPTPARPGA